jgi:hypothetical protein
MAAPRPKKPVVKKAPIKKKPSFLKKDTPRPARDLKKGDTKDLRNRFAKGNKPNVGTVKSPAETRASIFRKTRPAKDLKPSNVSDLRNQFLKRSQSSAANIAKASRVGGVLRAAGSRAFGAIGAIVDPTFMSGKGEGKLNNDPVTKYVERSSTMKGVEKKFKREIRQGTELAVTGVKTGIRGSTTYLSSRVGTGRPEYPSSNKGKASGKSSEYSGYGTFNVPKASGNKSKVGGPGGARALGSSSTAATVAAAASSGGGSQAASVANAGGKVKAKAKAKVKTGVGIQTRYERDSLTMEQRVSSGKPKKSIFSLFRKG